MNSEQMLEKQGGFTLLELLLAMVLSVIVITAMSAVFRSVVDSSMAVDAEMRLNQEGRVLLGILEKDLSALVVGNATGGSSDEGQALDFSASTGTISIGDLFMSFTTTNELYPQKVTMDPFNSVSYTLEEEQDGFASLVRVSRRYSQLSGGWEESELKLTKKLKAMRVEFTGVEAGLDLDGTDLSSALTLKVELTLQDGETYRDFSFIMPVRPARINLNSRSRDG